MDSVRWSNEYALWETMNHYWERSTAYELDSGQVEKPDEAYALSEEEI